MTVLDSLIAELKGVCAGLPDRRKGPRRDGEYTMADIGLSAFAVFFMVRTINRLKREEATTPTVRTTKACPMCAMEIPIAAKRCPHCTSEV